MQFSPPFFFSASVSKRRSYFHPEEVEEVEVRENCVSEQVLNVSNHPKTTGTHWHNLLTWKAEAKVFYQQEGRERPEKGLSCTEEKVFL